MITTLLARASIIVTFVLTLLADRSQRLAAAEDRGDENIKNVIYAALAVTLGVAVVAAITAAVNGKLPLIK